MGAANFVEVALGPSANVAFRQAVDAAAWEHGHGGYTGTIAEKGSYIAFPLPEGVPDEALPYSFPGMLTCGEVEGPLVIRGRERFVDGAWAREPDLVLPESLRPAMTDIAARVDDKWGPCGCFDITDTAAGLKHLAAELEQRQRTGTFEVGPDGQRRRVGPEPSVEGERVFVFFGWASE